MANNDPTGLVEIEGTSFEGQELSAVTDSIADADGLGAFSYQWLRAGEDISGATGDTYTLTPEDIGSQVSVRVTYDDGQGTTETLDSAPTDVIDSSVRSASPEFVAAGDEFRINTEIVNTQDEPSVAALSDGGFVVTWRSARQEDGDSDANGVYGVYGQRYDADGAPVGDEFQVNTETVGDQDQTAVTGLSDGGFVVTWASVGQDGDDYGVYGQRYDAAGVAVGAEFQINTYTTDSQEAPAVAALADGGFVVTWESEGQDGVGTGDLGQVFKGVYGQIYDAGGVAVGAEFQINTFTTDRQERTSVTGLSDGGFVVTWTSFGQDGDSAGVFGQRYDADGNATGDEFQINTFTAGFQLDPSVTLLADDGFVVTWGSFDQDGDLYGIYGQRYDAAGDAVGDEFRINTTTEGQQFRPSVSALSDGGFIVAWISDSDGSSNGIDAQRFDADGSAVGDEFQVNTFTDSFQFDPSVAGLPDGKLVVTWDSRRQDEPGGTSGVYGQVYTTNSSSTGQVEIDGTVSEGEELTADTASIADADGLGTFSYQWLRAGEAIDGATDETYTLTSADIGKQVSVRVTYEDGLGITETITSAPTEVVESSIRSATPGFVAVGDEFQVNTETTGIQYLQSVAGLAGGGFVVAWNTFDPDDDDEGAGILAQLYGADGTAIGGEFRVNTETASNQNVPSVAALGNGGFVVTWWSAGDQDGSSAGVYGQLYGADGTAVGDEFQVNTYTDREQVNPSVTGLADGGFVVTWDSLGQEGPGQGIGVFGQRYDADGVTVGDEFQVNSFTLGFQSSSSVTALADGGFVVTWDSSGQDDGSGQFGGGGIYGQRYAADGTTVDAEFRINTFTTNAQENPSVTALSDGGFVVTWESVGQDGDDRGIYGQRYGADGAAVGEEFQINTLTDNAQFVPSVTELADGGFVVTWVSQGQDGDLGGIYGQRYDADGATVGGEFQINTFTDNAQYGPDVAALSDGGFVVTWSSEEQDGDSTGVFSQRFASNSLSTGQVVIDGTLTTGQELTANTDGLADADGLGAFSYTWLRDGEAIDGATAATYTMTAADVGSEITVRVSYTDGLGITETISSAGVDPVTDPGGNSAPTGGVSVTGTVQQGEALSADTSTLADADGLGTLSYQWLRDGVAISGATAETYSLTQDDVGAAMSVRVSYTDGDGTVETVTSDGTDPVVNINDAPTGGVSVAGTAEQGRDLTADTSTLADADGLGTFSYQWLRDGVAVSGATGETYSLTQDDVGAVMSVRVSYTDGEGTAETVTSSGSSPVVNVNDAPTGGVSVTGTAAQGRDLTADTSTLADADGLGTFSYQWLRDGVAVSGATGETYSLTQDDVGAVMSVRVSYTDGEGTVEVLTSGSSSPVGNVNDAPAGGVSVTGTPEQGQELTADTSTLTDADGLGTFSYQWLRDGVAISGATGETYSLTQDDVGAAMSVRVSYTDGEGTVEVLTSDGTDAVANVNDAPTGGVSVSGTATENQVLSAISTLADPDGLGALSYQWLRDGVVISGATDETFSLTQDDVGAAISVQVSYTDGEGTDETVTSDATDPVANFDEVFTLDDGAETLSRDPVELFGNEVANFGLDDRIVLTGSQIQRDGIEVTVGPPTTISVDRDGDGVTDGAFTLQGDFSGGTFMSVVSGADTILTFETFLPELTEGGAVDPDLINGINNQAFLTGDGSKAFRVTLNEDLSAAANANTLGVYEVDADGNIVGVRILVADASATPGASIEVAGVADGNQLGFFLVENWGPAASALGEADMFSFVDARDGTQANIADGADAVLAVNGDTPEVTVFHSFGSDLNADGLAHAVSGVAADGESITIGFEDQSGGGDRDYQDVVFSVEPLFDFT